MRIWPGTPYPLGATWDGEGVELRASSPSTRPASSSCLFDAPEDGDADALHRLRERTDQVWHGYLPDVRPGQLYGYRVARPVRARARATASIRHKLLIDPYAKAITGDVRWNDALFGYTRRRPGRGPLARRRATAPAFMPKCVVVDAGLHVGRRPPAAHAVEPHGHLRVPRAAA